MFPDVSPPEESATFLSTSSGRTLNTVRVTSFRLDASELLGSRRLLAANPDPISDDQLIWQSSGGTFRGFTFAGLDQTNQGGVAGRAFLGGTFISMALAAMFLILEQFLVRRSRE